jgi:hypothetical protein
MSLPLPEIDGKDLTGEAQFLRSVVEPCRPLVLRDLVSAWPAVNCGTRSPRDFQAYLQRFDNGRETEMFVGDAAIDGKYYYTEDLKGFNFTRRRTRFGEAVEAIVAGRSAADAPTLYLGSVQVSDHLPGFAAQNVLPVLPPHIAPRIWLGHAAKVSAHFDAYDNVACVVAGRRRFTLFPPQAIANLYVGPIDHTMAGQPVSLAAAAAPDDAKYPLFRAVREQARSAELNPGDAIYIPKLWWHQIESLDAFNALVNYWWDAFASGPDAPYAAMLLGLITMSERPMPERQAWRAFFDHYVFRGNGHPLAHLPTEQHGMLGPLKPDNYGRIRARILQLLRGG